MNDYIAISLSLLRKAFNFFQFGSPLVQPLSILTLNTSVFLILNYFISFEFIYHYPSIPFPKASVLDVRGHHSSFSAIPNLSKDLL